MFGTPNFGVLHPRQDLDLARRDFLDPFTLSALFVPTTTSSPLSPPANSPPDELGMSSVIQTYVEEIFDVRTGRWLAGTPPRWPHQFPFPIKLLKAPAPLSLLLAIYVAGAGCLVFYDWLICLDDEYKYIWKSRRSLGKCLYFFHRYPLIAASVVALACESKISLHLRGSFFSFEFSS